MRYGEARLFVRVHDSPRSARVFSPVLQREELTEPVLRRLNELNTGASFVRFLHANGTIWASSDVLGHPLLPAHVVHACHVVGKVVNDLRDRLALELEDGAAATAPRPALLH